MQPSDTAYPRLKSHFSRAELERWYTPTPDELDLCKAVVRGERTRLGFLLALKTFQRLGYFVTSERIPEAIVQHIAGAIDEMPARESLMRYDASRSRKTHLGIIRQHLGVLSFDDAAKALLVCALQEAALTKDDLADILNVGIEVLVRHRYELPAFGTLAREARSQRAATYQRLFAAIHERLGAASHAFLDSLFVTDETTRTSPWNDLKRDAPKATLPGVRQLLERYDRLTELARYSHLLQDIPVVKLRQLALEGVSLDAASMIDLEPRKRYAVALALIRRQLARVTDDLCDVFCKQMAKAQHRAEAELNAYLIANQDKTDEILRRFASLGSLLQSSQSPEEKLERARQLVTSRPDLCEYSRVQAEYGGNNACRFLWGHFKPRRAELLRILSKLCLVATSQDQSFERALAFVLAQRQRQVAWLPLDGGSEHRLMSSDLAWIPDKWWKLVTGESRDKPVPKQLNRRQFEVCVCLQLVQELKSGDICVAGSEAYADYREELLPMPECERLRGEYGEQVGLPVETGAFVDHVCALLSEATTQTDSDYLKNDYFRIVDGRPTLGRLPKRPTPPDLSVVDEALTRKLQELDLSVLDVLGDTMKWLGWGRFFGPLSGHQGKLREEERRYILTTFAYGTGLGPTQAAKTIAGISDRQIAFVNQRHVTAEKLEAAIFEVINAYNRFGLPKYWGDTQRAAADGTKWDLYENNLLSEYHIRYGGYGGVAYYHVSDTYIALFPHFIPCGVWEAVYILDGLTKNQSDIQPDMLHGDTQAQSAPVYGLAYLLGIKLMPRIRNWKDLKCFKPIPGQAYRHINALFTKDAIDWKLIGRHLPDMLQVAQSIKAGRISPSTVLRKLGTASRKNKLYYTFRELGRVIRTVFLLEYLNDEELRRIIQAATNKCEGFNQFAQWVYFASDLIQENVRDEQLKIIKYNHLIANLLIFHNCYTMTEVLNELQQEGLPVTPEVLRALSPYRTQHISRFGAYELRDREVPPINYEVQFAAGPRTGKVS